MKQFLFEKLDTIYSKENSVRIVCHPGELLPRMGELPIFCKDRIHQNVSANSNDIDSNDCNANYNNNGSNDKNMNNSNNSGDIKFG